MSALPRRRVCFVVLVLLLLSFLLPLLVGSALAWTGGTALGSHRPELLIAKGGGGGGGGAGGGGGGGAGGGPGAGAGAGAGAAGAAGAGPGSGAAGAGAGPAGAGPGAGAAGAGAGAGVGAGGAAGAGAAGAAAGGAGPAGGGDAGASAGGGDGGTSSAGPAGGGSVGSTARVPAASPVAQWTASLEQAKSDLVARDFSRALLRAETVLRQTPAPGVRAAALLLSADAAYGLRAYTRASERYREFLSMYDLAIEAPQATLALGWAELRLGQVDRARRTWMQLARRYPLDDRAPLALVLAAGAAIRPGDPGAGRAQLDQVLADYEGGPVVEVARLSRAVLAARQSREDDAVRDLRELVRGERVCAAGARRALLRVMTEPGRGEPLMRVSHAGCAQPATAPVAAVPIERFAAPLL